MLDPGPGVAKAERIVEQLDRHITELRSGGHDVIYASLALRALGDLPHYATPRVVDGICRLLAGFVETVPAVRETDYNREHPLPAYGDVGDLRAVTLSALLRPWQHITEAGAGSVVHWVTHADALVTLEEEGYADVARRGHPAHQRYINHPVGPDEIPEPERAAVDWLGPSYWESDAPRRPQKGTWFFGHSFKLPCGRRASRALPGSRSHSGSTAGRLPWRLARAARPHSCKILPLHAQVRVARNSSIVRCHASVAASWS